MRILFFSDHFRPEPSAPAAHVYERAKLWVEWGHQVTVVGSAPNFPDGKVYPGYRNAWRFVENVDGIRVVRVKTFVTANEGFALRILDYMSYMLSAFFFAFFEERPDVVISTSPHLFVAAAGVAYALLRRVPHVFEIRDLWPASIASTAGLRPGLIYRLLERWELWLYRRSTRILALTHHFLSDLSSRGVPEDKIDVVINGANLALFSPRPRDGALTRKLGLEGKFVIGYLGTIGLAHGLNSVLDAAALLKDKRIVFLFVGVGAARDGLMKRCSEQSMRNVVWVPRQIREDMPGYWSVCDASLISLRDATVFETVIPSKIFESMAMGLPILYAGPRGEGSAIVAEHEAGLWIPPQNPRALAVAATALAEDTDRRRLLSSNSLAAAPRYSREAQARGTLEVLQKAISGYSGS